MDRRIQNQGEVVQHGQPRLSPACVVSDAAAEAMREKFQTKPFLGAEIELNVQVLS